MSFVIHLLFFSVTLKNILHSAHFLLKNENNETKSQGCQQNLNFKIKVIQGFSRLFKVSRREKSIKFAQVFREKKA